MARAVQQRDLHLGQSGGIGGHHADEDGQHREGEPGRMALARR